MTSKLFAQNQFHFLRGCMPALFMFAKNFYRNGIATTYNGSLEQQGTFKR